MIQIMQNNIKNMTFKIHEKLLKFGIIEFELGLTYKKKIKIKLIFRPPTQLF